MASAKPSKKKTTRSDFVLGLKAFEKISAVEGIKLSPEMRRDLQKIEDKPDDSEATKRLLLEKYRRPR